MPVFPKEPLALHTTGCRICVARPPSFLLSEKPMSDRTFDPTTWLDSFRETFASVHKAQQEGFKAVERMARFQYAVAGDYLEAGIAQTQAALTAKTPVDLLAKQ